MNGAYCVCGIRRSRIAKDLSQAGIPCDAWRVSNIELERRQSRYAWSREDERSEPSMKQAKQERISHNILEYAEAKS